MYVSYASIFLYVNLPRIFGTLEKKCPKIMKITRIFIEFGFLSKKVIYVDKAFLNKFNIQKHIYFFANIPSKYAKYLNTYLSS